MRSYSYLNSAVKIIGQYDGRQPFPAFLKAYFSTNKKSGSRDRKAIAHLCYCFFRLGKAITQIPPEERILVGLLLCSTVSNEILKEIKPEWNLLIDAPLTERLSVINYPSSISDVFPWPGELSEPIDHERFCESFFIQPDLYLRIRPGYRNEVIARLANAGIHFDEIEPGCLSFPNATKIERVIELDKQAVIQDYNSQKTGDYIKSSIPNLKSKFKAWDCCAGSGGKSLLVHDIFPNVHLTVSDIRSSILANLKKRFARAGINTYNSIHVDLSNQHLPLPIDRSPFDLIVCDAPCTGSGTWSRTPEQLYFFDGNRIEYYTSLQMNILSHAIPHLKPGGCLVYITCSVFRKENEEMALRIGQEFHLQSLSMNLLKGYDKKADTMFVSVFKNAS